MRDYFLIAPLGPSYAPAGIPDYIILRASLRLFFPRDFLGQIVGKRCFFVHFSHFHSFYSRLSKSTRGRWSSGSVG